MELQKKSWTRGRYEIQPFRRADEWTKDRKTTAGENGGHGKALGLGPACCFSEIFSWGQQIEQK